MLTCSCGARRSQAPHLPGPNSQALVAQHYSGDPHFLVRCDGHIRRETLTRESTGFTCCRQFPPQSLLYGLECFEEWAVLCRILEGRVSFENVRTELCAWRQCITSIKMAIDLVQSDLPKDHRRFPAEIHDVTEISIVAAVLVSAGVNMWHVDESRLVIPWCAIVVLVVLERGFSHDIEQSAGVILRLRKICS